MDACGCGRDTVTVVVGVCPAQYEDSGSGEETDVEGLPPQVEHTTILQHTAYQHTESLLPRASGRTGGGVLFQ